MPFTKLREIIIPKANVKLVFYGYQRQDTELSTDRMPDHKKS